MNVVVQNDVIFVVKELIYSVFSVRADLIERGMPSPAQSYIQLLCLRMGALSLLSKRVSGGFSSFRSFTQLILFLFKQNSFGGESNWLRNMFAFYLHSSCLQCSICHKEFRLYTDH